jgi:hypothetical protein
LALVFRTEADTRRPREPTGFQKCCETQSAKNQWDSIRGLAAVVRTASVFSPYSKM